ncbi:ATP-binding protein [Haloferax volcanii]|uniref:ATP-binding protein n=1 Tax=Haloferax volcanii TaxID=2246 RepID=UPI0023DB0CCE|nr:ATP-binding protein [Haloferax lucentense]WEL27314.1 Signal transduction histidine kinase, contains PAS domain [Haloferax lucentense]
MALFETLGSLALNAVAASLLGWTTLTAFRSREQPSAEPFIALLATLTLWSIFAFGAELRGVSSGDLLATVFSLGQLGSALIIPGIWIIYALSYTGRGTGLTWKRIGLLAGIALPVVVSGIVLAVGPSERAVERMLAPLIGWELLYVFVLFVYATYLLFDFGGSHARVSNTLVAILTGGVAAPYLVSLVGNNNTLVGTTTIGLFLSGVLLAVAVRRYPVMTGFPKADYVARTRVVETLQEAIVVLDWEDHILDLNEATEALFDSSGSTMIGEPIRSVIDGLEGTELPAGATGTVALRTSKGRRQFQFSVSAVDEAATDHADDPVARTVLFRDVTDQQTREQRLTVLNRILRHNVRNDLDVVLAYADHIDDDEIGTGIRESTSDLLELSKKVRGAEEVMNQSTDSPEPVDLTDVANMVVDQFRTDDNSADISLVCPDEIRISSHRAVIRQALSELVENSLAHTDKDSPHVEISVRDVSDGAVEISVADDGPGLPEREQEIVATGIETQLKHGQGIGLWFVNWAVTQLGGDLRFQENDPEGSIVTIRLYDAVR